MGSELLSSKGLSW